MYRKLNPLLIIFLAVFIVNCTNGRDPLLDFPGGKTFWATQFRGTTITPVQVPAIFAGESSNAKGYVALDSVDVLNAMDDVLRVFENNVVPVEHSMFRRPPDVNGDNKVTFLLLDIDDGATAGQSFLAGYFDPYNQFSDSEVNKVTCKTGTNCSRSNEQEMLYLDVKPARLNKNLLYSTLAHEYQHLLQFAHYSTTAQKKAESIWVNEGLSEISSDLTGFGPQNSRVSQFQSVKGNSLTRWDNPSVTDYANVYVYFRFLADALGNSVVSKIFNSTNLDIAGVNDGINAMGNSNTVSTSTCGTNQTPQYSAFDCTYRYMWAAIISQSGTIMNGDKGGMLTTKLLTRPSGYNFTTIARPSVATVSALNSQLYPYAAEVHTKAFTASANLSGAAISDFTLFYADGTSSIADRQTYVVYNHNMGATNTSSINVSPVVSVIKTNLPSSPIGALAQGLSDPLNYQAKPPVIDPNEDISSSECGRKLINKDNMQLLLTNGQL